MRLLRFVRSFLRPRFVEPYADIRAEYRFRVGISKLEWAARARADGAKLFRGAGLKLMLAYADELEAEAALLLAPE